MTLQQVFALVTYTRYQDFTDSKARAKHVVRRLPDVETRAFLTQDILKMV